MHKKSPVIVAELSGNHSGSLQRAMDLIALAHENGADAVKIQTYSEDSLTIDCNHDEFILKGGLWDGYKLYDLYKEAKTPAQWVKPLFEFAKDRGILLFSSPFSFEDVDALEAVDCPWYKIASFEINYLELIEYCAQTKKPIIMSTGLARLDEIDRAVDIVKRYGNDLTLLHCESRYPADPAMFNLNTIPFFAERYGCAVGLSNHSIGDTLDIAAIALGASMIEKHFIDTRKAGGVDSAFSMNVQELRCLAEHCKTVYGSLGVHGIRRFEEDKGSMKFRRSVYLVADIKQGEVLTQEHVRTIRPGMGLEPYKLKDLLGRRAVCDLQAPQPLDESNFE